MWGAGAVGDASVRCSVVLPYLGRRGALNVYVQGVRRFFSGAKLACRVVITSGNDASGSTLITGGGQTSIVRMDRGKCNDTLERNVRRYGKGCVVVNSTSSDCGFLRLSLFVRQLRTNCSVMVKGHFTNKVAGKTVP